MLSCPEKAAYKLQRWIST